MDQLVNNEMIENCQAVLQNGSMCSESKSLVIIDEFNAIYEDRINFIDREAGGDNVKLKYPVYQNWVRDLTLQNRELIRVVEELEAVACSRLALLENKLYQDSKDRQGIDFDNNKIYRLESDMKNLLELIRRARENRIWDASGLEFLELEYSQIFGDPNIVMRQGNENQILSLNVELLPKVESSQKAIASVTMQDSNTDNELTLLDKVKEIEKSNELTTLKIGQTTKMSDDKSDKELYDLLHENNQLRIQIEGLQSELSNLRRDNGELEKASLDTKVLVLEVADKHDTILKLRTEIGSLEDRLRQADMQTHFKDDVIKELRRECKNLAKSVSLTPPTNECIDQRLKELSDVRQELVETKKNLTKIEKEHSNEIEKNQKIKTNLEKLKEETAELLNLQDHNMFEQQQYDYQHEHKDPDLEIVGALKHDIFHMKSDYFMLQQKFKDITDDTKDLNNRFQYICKENEKLKDTIAGLNDSLSRKLYSHKETITDRVQNCDEKLLSALKELSIFLGKDMSSEEILQEPSNLLTTTQTMVNDMQKEIAVKDSAFEENKKMLENLKEKLLQQNNEISDLKNQYSLYEMERATNQKMIIDLQSDIKIHINTMKQLEKDKLELQEKLAHFKQPNEIINKLLDEKIHLEIENKHQMTTISNLKSALENVKKNNNGGISSSATTNNGSVSSVASSTNNKSPSTAHGGQQSGSSLWSWWRTVHDV